MTRSASTQHLDSEIFADICDRFLDYLIEHNSGPETDYRGYSTGRIRLCVLRLYRIETPTAPGNETAGIDLGICNFAAVAYSTEEADLYPGNRLKQDGYYFPKEIAKCDDSDREETTRLHAKWSERRTHFFHSLSKHFVQRCVEQEVGHIYIGELAGVREGDNGESKNWGKHGSDGMKARKPRSSRVGVRQFLEHPRIQGEG